MTNEAGTIGGIPAPAGSFGASLNPMYITDTKQLSVSYEDRKLKITSEGKIKKFIHNIDQISFSGKIAIEEQREIIYITERCVFRLTPEGLLLTEIAPGIDLQRDIFNQMECRPSVAENLKEMSANYFRI